MNWKSHKPRPDRHSAYRGLAPSRPANRRPHNTTANTVDTINVTVARFFHPVPHKLPWDGASRQPRASMSTVMTKNGQVSTCNAGAKANPADVPPKTPSRPDTTHHQGSGSSPLSRPTNGFSICSNFIVFSTLSSTGGRAERSPRFLPSHPLPMHRRLSRGHRPDGRPKPGDLEGRGAWP